MLSRRLKYITRILVWGILGIHIGIWILLNIPSVQGRLASLVSVELSKLLDTEVSVGHVELGLFNRIHVENVLLEDRQGEEMLKVSRLSARFELKPLLEGKITINSVQLIGFSIHLKKETPESIPNFQFVVDALASKDTLNKSPNLDLRINSVLLQRGHLTYDVLSAPETPGKFNASHVGIRDLSASVSIKALRNDSLNAIVRRLGFEEQSGFQLKKLGMKLVADNNHLNVNEFRLEFPTSALMLDSVEVRFDSLANLSRMTDDVYYKGQLNGSLVLKDFEPLLPVFKNLDRPLDFALKFNGQGKNTEIPLLSLHDENNLLLKGNGSVINWDAKRDMFLQCRVSDFMITQSGIPYFLGNLIGSVPPILQRLEHVQLRGNADGYLHDLKVSGMVRTAAGMLNANMRIDTDENNNRTYSGGLSSPDMNVAKLLGDAKFGMADFNVELEGFNYQNQYPESYIKGIISSFDYSNYRYENIVLDGIYKDGGYNGHLSLDDENGNIQIDGIFNTTTSTPNFNLQASIKDLRPYELNLSDKYKDSDISLDLVADFTGNSIDDMNGMIRVDKLKLDAPDNQSYFMDSLVVTAGQVQGGQKEIQIKSPFMYASVNGEFSYQTLPNSIVQTVRRYIPSLLSANGKPVQSNNNFKFDVWLDNAELFKKMFFIPLDVHMPVTLKGYFNDKEEQLQLEGSFPSITYDGTLFESGTLLCENPAEQFNCLVRGSMLMNSGAMLNLSVDAQAEHDRLKTVLNWGNNTDVTYGGQVSAITRFFKTEGKSPILQADIDILPTKVILNDAEWNIRSSHVAIDSGRVYIDNFLFETRANRSQCHSSKSAKPYYARQEQVHRRSAEYRQKHISSFSVRD